LTSRAPTEVVEGIELRGMSITVVTPPEMAAKVPDVKPSQDVLPGWLRWTWALSKCSSTRSSVVISLAA
jgi:hypothetical protein